MSEPEGSSSPEARPGAAEKAERTRARALRREARAREALRREARAREGALRQEERSRVIASRKDGSEAARAKIEGAAKFASPRTTHIDAPDGGACSIACSEQATARLKVFTDVHVKKTSRKLSGVGFGPWPRLEGCLAMLFSSRSGSTYLARELECAFEIGRLRESFNPPRMKSGATARIVESGQDPWFSFKAGATGVIVAELSGFFEAHLRDTSFILLVRKDIVAQAVSRVKAKQTGQWHSTQTSKRAAVYDKAKIAQSISLIVSGVESLRLYAERSERPWRPLPYEAFADGDFTQAMAACDAFGVPRRGPNSGIRPARVQRIGDAVNGVWVARFREEMDSPTRELIERYQGEI